MGEDVINFNSHNVLSVSVNFLKTFLSNSVPPNEEKGGGNSVNLTNLRGVVSKNAYVALVDTGSNLNLSGCKDDFSDIKSEATVCITAIDGDINDGLPIGYVGKFRENQLGIKYGVFYPGLGEQMRILSGKSILRAGWPMALSGASTSRIESGQRIIPVLWGQDKLPYVLIKFSEKQGGHPCPC